LASRGRHLEGPVVAAEGVDFREELGFGRTPPVDTSVASGTRVTPEGGDLREELGFGKAPSVDSVVSAEGVDKSVVAVVLACEVPSACSRVSINFSMIFSSGSCMRISAKQSAGTAFLLRAMAVCNLRNFASSDSVTEGPDESEGFLATINSSINSANMTGCFSATEKGGSEVEWAMALAFSAAAVFAMASKPAGLHCTIGSLPEKSHAGRFALGSQLFSEGG